jgi:serine protease Do
MRTHRILLTALAVGAPLLLLWPIQARPQSAQRPEAAVAGGGLAQRRTPVVSAIDRVRDAVVNIHSERSVQGPIPADDLFAFAPSQSRINGMGSGILVDPRGYIVTNQHVVEEVQSIRVRLRDGTVVPARVVARDPESDLALLKIDAARPLAVMPLGTAADVMVGETVIAIGNAYGYEHTVTTGIVSAVGRDVVLNKDVSYKALIQTDTAINPGNSGGPLLNVNGELIGVTVAIRAGAQNIGFAIPVDTMIRVTAALMGGKGRTSFPVHGLFVRDEVRKATEDTPFSRSVVVQKAEPGGPGAQAGMQPGDVLLKAGDLPISSSLDLERAFVERPAGEHVPVVFRRGVAEQRAELVVEPPHPAPVSTDLVWRKLGLKLQGVGADGVARSHPQLHGGLAVLEVRPNSSASKAGLQRGDVLVGLHQWEMLSLENVLFVLNHPDLNTFNPMRFFILRGGQVHRGWLEATAE